MIYDDLKRELRNIYIQQGWTETLFAKRLRVSEKTVARIWESNWNNMSLSRVSKIANALSRTLDIWIV